MHATATTRSARTTCAAAMASTPSGSPRKRRSAPRSARVAGLDSPQENDMTRILVAASFLLAACAADTVGDPVGSVAAPIGAGTFEEVTGFGSNPGALKMFRYVPTPAPTGAAPLVVALHACSQGAL